MVSIHAPVKVRPLVCLGYLLTTGVSIHAPVKVRPKLNASGYPKRGFNSRTCEGATKLLVQYLTINGFQFTHL